LRYRLLTDAEIDAAIEAGKQARFPRLLDISYDVESDTFKLTFHDGMKLVIARRAMQLKGEPLSESSNPVKKALSILMLHSV
jgi:hypothetical protein